MVPSKDSLLTEREAAQRLQVSKETLARLRKAGTGPIHVPVGKRLIRYRREDLAAFTEERGKP